jgi:hypothetical protein
MTTDHFRYDLLTRDALRGVLRHVLAETASKGLVGDHHFYITFLTQTPGVKLSPRLIAQYPEEMTIILQHQFWDLQVTGETFEVGLSFNGIPERLLIPFAAIKSFYDPSVQFGLQFEVGEDKSMEQADTKAGKDAPVAAAGTREAGAKDTTDTGGAPDAPAKSGNGTTGAGAEVVRLDRFRKK